MKFYRNWQTLNVTERPEAALVDGFLCGAAIALEAKTDHEWIADVVAANDPTADMARSDLLARLSQIREGLDQDEGGVVPILSVREDGDFDISAWATGFAEAIGNDLETWAYLLAGCPESGRLGLLLSHAVGTEGEAARRYVAGHPQTERLSAIAEEGWTYISTLLTTLYRIKAAMAGER